MTTVDESVLAYVRSTCNSLSFNYGAEAYECYSVQVTSNQLEFRLKGPFGALGGSLLSRIQSDILAIQDILANPPTGLEAACSSARDLKKSITFSLMGRRSLFYKCFPTTFKVSSEEAILVFSYDEKDSS